MPTGLDHGANCSNKLSGKNEYHSYLVDLIALVRDMDTRRSRDEPHIRSIQPRFDIYDVTSSCHIKPKLMIKG
jgi:hypothetical protein